MDLNRLTRDADDLIRKVVSRYNQLYVPAGQISQVELDLLLDDMRKLYDTFKTIGQVNLDLKNSAHKPEVLVNTTVKAEPQRTSTATPLYDETPAAPPLSPTPPAEPEVIAEAEPEEEILAEQTAEPVEDTEFVPAVEPVEETLFATAEEPEEETAFEPVAEVEEETEFTLTAETEDEEANLFSETEPDTITATVDVPAVEPEFADAAEPFETFTRNAGPPPSPETMQGMLADRFATGNKSLSETIAPSQSTGGTGSRLMFQPIADLTTGIGFNDRFSFIRELFDNNTLRYDEAISRINKAVNHDEAGWILQKYHTPDWDQKEESVVKMKEFLKRRFV
jgi:hypothetical protein